MKKITHKETADALTSLTKDNQSAVARNLVHILANVIEQDKELGGKKVADALLELRMLCWPSKKLGEPANLTREQREEGFKRITAALSPKEREQLQEAAARMGHLHEMAGLIARENFFDAIRTIQAARNPGEYDKPLNSSRSITPEYPNKLPLAIPGGAAEFVNGQESVEEAVGKLNQPIFEAILTAHPTNTNTLLSMQDQRELIAAVFSGNALDIETAMHKFAHDTLTNRVKQADGSFRNVNFTVRDETEMMVQSLLNIYDDLPNVYRAFDNALAKKANQTGENYDRTALRLNLQLGSWGSGGDKDGNNNLFAEHTLEALVIHSEAIVSRYLRDLNELQPAAGSELQQWQEKLKQASRELSGLKTATRQLTEDAVKLRDPKETEKPSKTAQMLEDEFDRCSQALRAIRKGLSVEEFEKATLKQLEATNMGDEAAHGKLVNLLRRVRTFGFNLAKVEYRETAEEYARVTNLVLREQAGENAYEQLEPEAKRVLLNRLLQEGGLENVMSATLRREITEQGATKPYIDPKTKKADPRAIAYTTLKRMELARDHGDMIRDNVLAECGALEDPEALPLNASEDERRAHREAWKATLDKNTASQGAANMLEAVLLQKIVGRNDEGKEAQLGVIPLFEEPGTMQRVDQILEKAYKTDAYLHHLKDVSKAHGLAEPTQETQIAHSDNARRASLSTARANIHEAHERIRAVNKKNGIGTRFFEGGSMSDSFRNGVRAISGTVNELKLHDFAKFTFQGGDLLNYFSAPCSTERLMVRNFCHGASNFIKDGAGFRKMTDEEWAARSRKKMKAGDVPDDAAIAVATQALKDLLPRYEDYYFRKDTLGVLLDAMGYHKERDYGNAGSRGGARGAGGGAIDENTINPVDVISGTRTIPFSEVPQINGMNLSWLGAQDLEEKLVTAIRALPVDQRTKDFATAFCNIIDGSDNTLSPMQWNFLYKRAPVMQDAIDRFSNAHAFHDPQLFDRLEAKLEAKQDAVNEQGESYKKIGKEFLDQLRKDYEATGRFTYAALAGDGLKDGQDLQQAIVSKQLAGKEVQRKTALLEFFNHERDKGALSEVGGRVANNGSHTGFHGRMLRASDKEYGAAYGRYTGKDNQLARA